MPKRPFKPTANDISVYIELLGIDDGRKKTQKELHEILGLSAGGINGIVQKLQKEEIIRRQAGSRTDIMYDPGKHETKLTCFITDEYLEARRNELLVNQRGRFPTSKEKYRQLSALLSLSLPMRAHFPYTPPRFKVLKQGNMDFTNDITIGNGRKPLRFPIFSNPKVKGLPGQDKYISSFSTDGDDFEIIFLKTHPKKGPSEMKFFIQPKEDLEFLITDVETEYEVGMLIVKQCHKVLNFLQKHAGWVFSYEPLNDVSRVHICCADDDINDKIFSLTGRKVHELEKYKYWMDGSHRKQVHIESSTISFFKALDRLTETVEDVDRLNEEIKDLGRFRDRSELHDTVRDYKIELIEAEIRKLKEESEETKKTLKDQSDILKDHTDSFQSVASFQDIVSDVLMPERAGKKIPQPVPAFDGGMMYR